MNPNATAGAIALLRLLVVTAAALLLTLAAFALLRAGVLVALYAELLHHVVETTGLDLWQSRALTLLLLVLLWLVPWHFLLLPWVGGARRRVLALAVLAVLGLSVTEFLTKEVYFSRADGRPLKYYIQTLDGYKFAAAPGTDPAYGVPYRPITTEVAKSYLLWKKRGGNIQDPALPEGRYFDPGTGEPLRWYAKRHDGRIEMFTLSGFHPTFGTKLLPATPATVALFEKQKADAERQRQDEERKRRERELGDAQRQAAARQAREEAALRQPLQSGRYLFGESALCGIIDGYRFRLTEADLASDKMIVHLSVENLGAAPGGQRQKHIRFGLILPDGTSSTFTAIRPKEGALPEANGAFYFPQEGRHGAFVMEFRRPADVTTFSIAINDEPLFSGINLRRLAFQSF